MLSGIFLQFLIVRLSQILKYQNDDKLPFQPALSVEADAPAAHVWLTKTLIQDYVWIFSNQFSACRQMQPHH